MVRVAAVLCLVSALVSGPQAAGQTDPPDLNTSRMARFDPHPDITAYNDVWGYAAPDGREYALLGMKDGFMIVNCTDPVAPYEVAFYPGTLCTWRDLKTWSHYVYVVTDCAGGVDVVDMADPENPVYMNNFGSGQFANAHNVAIDTGTGLLYAVGTNNGMRIYNLVANPVNPPQVGSWNNSYVHDISVKDGMAHAALIYAGIYRILNVSNPGNITTIDSISSGENFAHATWPNEDNTLVVGADETTGDRHLLFYDTSNPTAITKAGVYTENSNSIPHNPFLKDDVCHVSWYTEGYIALDVSDPAAPVKIGRFDTQKNTSAGGQSAFMGAWGCYPFSPSGFIYVSDRQRGLFVVSLNECSIDLPPAAAPQICKVWPDSVSALNSPRARVVITGAGFGGASSVSVGGTVLTPADFSVEGDQLIHFRLPLVASIGPNAITVTNASGTSSAAQIQVSLPNGPSLDTGEVEQPVGSPFLVAMGSAPGHLLFPVFAFSQSPSVIPGKVAFDIGNAFSDMFFLDSLVANAAGVNGFPVVAPAAGLGVTLYWQVAVVDPQAGLPAAVTPFTTTIIVDPQ